MSSLSSAFTALRPSIFRVTIQPPEGERSVATAFLVKPGVVLTCAHAVLGVTDVAGLAARLTESKDEVAIGAAIRSYAADVRSWVSVEDDAGKKVAVQSIEFDWRYDVAVLNIDTDARVVSVDPTQSVTLGADLWFCGFGDTIQTGNAEWPLSVVQGTAMSRASVTIGGYTRRPFVFVQAPSFGGHSGGALIDRDTGTCIGMVNGHMTWGADKVHHTKNGTKNELLVADVYIPVGVTFTSLFADIAKDCPLLQKALA